jgi:hypothetical protein
MRRKVVESRTYLHLFIQHHSLSAVVAELVQRRWKTKSWTSQSGTMHVGRDFSRRSLQQLLTNAIYAGTRIGEGSHLRRNNGSRFAVPPEERGQA